MEEVKNYYEDLPETEFVPLDCIDEVFKGLYEINKLGEIKTKSTGKIRKNFVSNNGHYPRVSFRHGEIKLGYSVHILLAKTFIPNPENKPQVDHIDRNGNNYSLSNLRWSTVKDNLLNRAPDAPRKKKLFFLKLDDNKNIIEKIFYTELDPKEVDRINSCIRNRCKHDGFYWERGDESLLEYEARFGNPKEEDWRESRFPGLFCNKNGLLRFNGRYIVGFLDVHGYRVTSYKRIRVFIHRLVYETFSGIILKENEYIDHINTIKDDNRFENLRKGTRKDNMNNELTKQKFSKPVKRFSLEGKLIQEYLSLKDATNHMKSLIKGIEDYNGRTSGLSHDNTIQLCCDGKISTAFTFLWCHSGDEQKILEDQKNFIFRYDKEHNLVKCFRSINSISNNNSYMWKSISKSLKTGELCYDGFYYSRGPRIWES